MRTFHVGDVSGKSLKPIVNQNVDSASALMTDEASVYKLIGKRFASHGTVNHSANEYARSYFWHTNTIENYFSLLKRGIVGVYHHVSEARICIAIVVNSISVTTTEKSRMPSVCTNQLPVSSASV